MSEVQKSRKILSKLLQDEKYAGEVFDFLKPEYFDMEEEKEIFAFALDYFTEYEELPSKEVIAVKFNEKTDKSADKMILLHSVLNDIFQLGHEESYQWYLDETEEWGQRKALFNAIDKSIELVQDNKDKNAQLIMDTMSDALGVSLQKNVGHNYNEGAEERFDFYSEKEEKVPFGLANLDAITKGGMANKTLSVIMGGTGGGKTLMMCSLASAMTQLGRNVLYISLEMSDKRIAQRIDMNKLQQTQDQILSMGKMEFKMRIENIMAKTSGRLYIKEYAPSTAGGVEFNILLKELREKQDFIPDIVMIDYLNLCISNKKSSKENSYSYIKHVAEELRAVAVNNNLPILTATQSNREGFGSSDPELVHISESFGLAATADLVIAIIATDELAENRLLIKQLKNRYNDLNFRRKFYLGVQREYMSIFDVDESENFRLAGRGHDIEETEYRNHSDYNSLSNRATTARSNFSGIEFN